jgi:hypothetical protein
MKTNPRVEVEAITKMPLGVRLRVPGSAMIVADATVGIDRAKFPA